MQAVYPETDIPLVRLIYGNRQSPSAFKATHAEPLRDVVHLVEADSGVQEEVSAFLAELHVRVVAFASATDYLDSLGREAKP